jgi:hypothetical protein
MRFLIATGGGCLASLAENRGRVKRLNQCGGKDFRQASGFGWWPSHFPKIMTAALEPCVKMLVG